MADRAKIIYRTSPPATGKVTVEGDEYERIALALTATLCEINKAVEDAVRHAKIANAEHAALGQAVGGLRIGGSVSCPPEPAAVMVAVLRDAAPRLGTDPNVGQMPIGAAVRCGAVLAFEITADGFRWTVDIGDTTKAKECE